ncbi:Transposon Tf2-9 polyprotein [Labeo rohita]|uniref:Gypsy retrotransposon integrase-like protein 1 n=1 Tax=Labeo rohita TaxID=84645 RepID=A0ABQ8MGX0_LABRO|nr:Transposon Tf2-9 polyprotein [Labeo rohita]
MSNPDPFQELVDSLRKVLLRSPTTMPSTPPPDAPPAPSTSSATIPSSPMARPAPYSGGAEECNGFLLQCSLIFTMQPALYPTDQSQITLITSLLTGPALRWAETIWHQAGPPTRFIQAFIAHFKEVFSHADEKVSAGEQLYHLKQGTMTTHEYSLRFRTLAAASGWNELSLLTTYRLGLEPKLRLQLAALDDNIGLEKFIQQSLRCSDRIKFYQSNQETVSTALLRPSEPVNPSELEPMIIESGKLTSAERQRRLTWGLYMYCGASGHVRLNCPLRPVRTSVSGIHSDIENMHPLTTNVQLTTPSSSVAVTALIDFGSAGNFISGNLCRQLQLRTEASSRTYQIQPITVNIGLLHKEDIQFLVLEGATVDIILGCPWLVKHDPIISWGFGEVLKWGEGCTTGCFPELPQPIQRSLPVYTTSIESPIEKQSVQIPDIYTSYKDVFCPKRASQLPPHRPWDCAIDLIPDAPMPRGKIYPLSLPETKAMEEYIQEALSQGYIRPSTSPAASSFFFVAKKDGGLRPCIDYRTLNQGTIKFRYPLPLVPAALEQLRSARIFTKLDLRSAYNLVRIREGDEWKTTFVTPTGHYEYLVMPYGLVNAPSVFQNFIHEVLREFLHHFVVVYIDDILIYSQSEAEHRHHVAEVLKKLREHQLYLKAEKCSFHLPSVKFLGYCIDHQGVRMDERKVSAVVSWPEPTTIKELQRFLGFSNFYRRFIQDYSIITTPLTNLLSGKPRTLLWTPEAAEAFHSLKSAFTQAPLLTHPDPDLPFVVEVDASTTGVGAVLSQYHGTPKLLHPCAYFSRKLSPAERNYDVGNRELLAIKLALEEWRHWLEGAIHPFQVITDHKNLQYLRDAKRLCPRQARWSLFFSRFNFSITYRPGSKNIRADALSRLHDHPETSENPANIIPEHIIVNPIEWSAPPIVATPAPRPPPGCPPGRQFVPQTQRVDLIHSMHTSLGTGHPGVNNTLSLLSDRFWWPSMARDVRRYVQGCKECAISPTLTCRETPSFACPEPPLVTPRSRLHDRSPFF